MDGNSAASKNPGRIIDDVPTPAEIRATVEEDASIDLQSPLGGAGQRLLTLPNGELVVKQVPVSATSQPEHLHQVAHPNTAQLDRPAPNFTDELSAIERDADESRADDGRLTTVEVRRRDATGAVVDVLRAVGVRRVALLGALVPARPLTYEFEKCTR